MRPRTTMPRLHVERHAGRLMLTPTTRRRTLHGTCGQGHPAVATRDRLTTATAVQGDNPHLNLVLTMMHGAAPLDVLTTNTLNTVIHALIEDQGENEGASARLPGGRAALCLLLLGSRVCAVATAGVPGECIGRAKVMVLMIIISPLLAVLGLFVGWAGPWGSGALTRPPRRRSGRVPMPPTTPLLDLWLHRVPRPMPTPPTPPGSQCQSQCPRLPLSRARTATRMDLCQLRLGPRRGRSSSGACAVPTLPRTRRAALLTPTPTPAGGTVMRARGTPARTRTRMGPT